MRFPYTLSMKARRASGRSALETVTVSCSSYLRKVLTTIGFGFSVTGGEGRPRQTKLLEVLIAAGLSCRVVVTRSRKASTKAPCRQSSRRLALALRRLRRDARRR